MKAVAAIEKGKVAVVDIPVPEISEYECLVRITACGLCSSTDLKIISNSIANLDIQYPTILGHEGVGVIEKTGAKVRNFKVGDRVVNPNGRVMPGCGFSSNWAHMAAYGVTTDVKAMWEDGVPMRGKPDLENYPTKPIPDEISDVDAVMLLTFKENYSALKNFGMHEGMNILIYGDGAVAHGLAVMARDMGAAFVGIVGHHDDRIEKIAQHVKLDLAVNSHKESVLEKTNEMGVRFDIVVDGVGSVDIIREGARMCKPFGRVGLYGVLKYANANINLVDLPNNVMLQTLNWPYREHAAHDEVLDLVRRGLLDPKDFYSHVLPLERVAEGVEMIRNRQAYKVIIDMTQVESSL